MGVYKAQGRGGGDKNNANAFFEQGVCEAVLVEHA